MNDVVGLNELELCKIIQEIAGENWKVIVANQDGNKPKKPYIVFRNTETKVMFHLESRNITDDGIGSFNSAGQQTVELESYGPNAKATLDRITAKLRLPSIQYQLSNINVSFIGPLSSTDLSRLVMDSQTEERALSELRFGFTQELSDDVGLIDTIVVELGLK